MLPLLLALIAVPADPPPPVLAIARPTLHHKQEDGPMIPEGYRYLSGELLYLSFRIQGFKLIKDKVDLRWQAFAVDPQGLLLAPPTHGAFTDEVNYNDRNWLPKVAQTLPLPPQIPPGSYKLKIRVTDENAKATVEHELPFEVGGKPFPEAKSFSALNLAFYRDEAEREPLEKPVYRAGQTLLARFQAAGFQLGDKNRFEVSYSMAVLSGEEDAAQRKILFEQPEAASDTGAPFYPQRHLTGTMTLNITDGVSPGRYYLQIRLRDRVGNAETVVSAPFLVEK